MSEYAMSFQIHGDGIPYLIDYSDDTSHFCYVVMIRDIADDLHFQGKLEHDRYYDYETPYGYGGPLSDDIITEESQRRFLNEMGEYAKERGIVSQFVRFHPLLLNHEIAPIIFETKYSHDTIYINTESTELIMQNMDSKNRNMVRKALKNGINIARKNITEYRDFLPMYFETMKRDDADAYYFFTEEYFKAQLQLQDNACIFYAIKDNRPVAAAIMYYNDRFINYHLAGMHTEYRKYAPSNLLLYETACWASERGIKKFHLGGGLIQDDNLFGFKKKFNKNGRLPFVVGKTVFNKEAYKELLDIRKSINSEFNENNDRMTQYRA